MPESRPGYTNHLAQEKSAYLLQHADNPVNWYPWGPEALEEARRADKPLLISIGYSACHWCHVMERESFADSEVAAFMNRHFINIKVDREERPDLDQIYMEAVQILTRSGGWPLNVFCTPTGKPFFGGTYFPPRPASGRPSWRQILESVSRTFRDKRDQVEEQAKNLLYYVKGNTGQLAVSDVELHDETQHFSTSQLHGIFEGLEQQFDRKNGGFGRAPKFPSAMSLRYLLRYHYLTGVSKALDHVRLSLDNMIRGGIYDHLGGGFARYTTDEAWRIPHFEKMLYDNALLATLLAETVQVTDNEEYKGTLRQTLDFVKREMSSREGGFYAAYDADSEGEEGKYYVWSKTELDDLLGEDAALFHAFYNVREAGNWEAGKNILYRTAGYDDFAQDQGMPPALFREKIAAARKKLLKVRSKRKSPLLDDKCILAWNGLMCTAFVKASQALGEPAYLKQAIKNARFCLKKLKVPAQKGLLLHVYNKGEGRQPAFLDDYAAFIRGLIELYQATFDNEWLAAATELTDFVVEHFHDPGEGLCYYTMDEQKDIVTRTKSFYDNATPSGNAMMAGNFRELALLTGKDDYHEIAHDMLVRLSQVIVKYPSAFGHWACVMASRIAPLFEVAIVGSDYKGYGQYLLQHFLPNKVIMGSDKPLEYPLLKGKTFGQKTRIYVCREYACKAPVNTPEEAINQIKHELKPIN